MTFQYCISLSLTGQNGIPVKPNSPTAGLIPKIGSGEKDPDNIFIKQATRCDSDWNMVATN